MELPPGWRGYGEKNHIAHPHSEIRQQEIEQIKQTMSSKARFTLHESLMPYAHQLPIRYQGRNERIDESLP